MTVAMLNRTAYAGNGGHIKHGKSADELILEKLTTSLGWPKPQQEIRQSAHFHSATCAGNFMPIDNGEYMGQFNFDAIARGRGRPCPQQDVHQSNYFPRAAHEDWQTSRHALDSTIENLLQKLMPPDSAIAAPALLSQDGMQRALAKAVPPPPGLEDPLQAGLPQSDVLKLLENTDIPFLAPPGLGRERNPVRVGSEAWDVVKSAPTVENVPLPAMFSRGSSKNKSMEGKAESVNSEEALDKGGRRTLLIAYYPRGTTEEGLRSIFESFGKVHIVNLVKDKSGLPMCYGFIRFAEASTAEQAYLSCQTGRVIMHDLDGKAWHLKASWAKNAFGKKGKGAKRARAPACVLADE
mmetsp:Transcript_30817/g.54725  ORF Transcript_30817/g.54725 Transcript_30817/m.54725 type:complete len:352 (-) Transcript_30817:73-1128(-)